MRTSLGDFRTRGIWIIQIRAQTLAVSGQIQEKATGDSHLATKLQESFDEANCIKCVLEVWRTRNSIDRSMHVLSTEMPGRAKRSTSGQCQAGSSCQHGSKRDAGWFDQQRSRKQKPEFLMATNPGHARRAQQHV